MAYSQKLPIFLQTFALLNLLLPTLLTTALSHYAPPTQQQCLLTKCFSLLLLGMFLATLSTLNFSLAFLIGLLATPLSFIGIPYADATRPPLWRTVAENVMLHALAPPIVFAGLCFLAGIGVEQVLAAAAFGWRVSGLWTQVVVWCVWWPAWVVGAVFVSPGQARK